MPCASLCSDKQHLALSQAVGLYKTICFVPPRLQVLVGLHMPSKFKTTLCVDVRWHTLMKHTEETHWLNTQKKRADETHWWNAVEMKAYLMENTQLIHNTTMIKLIQPGATDDLLHESRDLMFRWSTPADLHMLVCCVVVYTHESRSQLLLPGSSQRQDESHHCLLATGRVVSTTPYD